MISTLIVDDNAEKLSAIRDVLLSIPGVQESWISTARDLIHARDAVRSHRYDLLILDIRLPNKLGDTTYDQGGIDFVKELMESDQVLTPFHIVGITQYDELLIEAGRFFGKALWHVVKYDPSNQEWEERLRNLMTFLLQSQKSIANTSHRAFDYDLAIVTALASPEHTQILALPGSWEKARMPNDATDYHLGTFPAGTHRVKVVTACAPKFGMTSAAVLSMKVIEYFRPRYLAIAGIAAGVAEGGRPGDILIADQTWDYDSGKRRVEDGTQVFAPDPRSLPLSIDLIEIFNRLAASRAFLDDIREAWPGNPSISCQSLQAFVGPVASGGAVIQGIELVEGIRRVNRKLIGVEMETYGVFYAAENCARPRPTPFSIKSISDDGSEDKNDEFQEYAAFTSAQYLWRFVTHELLAS